jgi:tetratricopeptide (TPR) repeat protein
MIGTHTENTPMTDGTAQQTDQSRAKVFISYSRKDIAFADRLDAALRARGFEPLIDRTDIYAFEEWWDRIEALIGRADTVVFVISPDAVASEIALKEVAEAASLNKRFAPVVWRRVDDKLIPEPLAKLNFIFFDDEAQFEQRADQLTEALRTDIGWIRQHTDFGEQARRWAQAKGASGLLLRSPVLEQAERWIASRPPGAPAPTDETQAFIRQSRQGATRRRNVLTGSLAAGLVLALVLAGLAYWQRGVAVEQRGIAQQNEAQAKLERDNATRNFELAQKTAESLVYDIARGLRNALGMSSETVRKILETAKTTFEQLTSAAPDDLSLQSNRSVMLEEFGNTYLILGDLQHALTAHRESLGIRERLAAADPSNMEWQRDVAASYNKVGDVLVKQGSLDEALKNYRDSLAIMERLAATEPGNTNWQRPVSVLYRNVGNVLLAQGKLDEALKAYRDGLTIAEKLSATDSSNTLWQRDLYVSFVDVGDVLLEQSKLDEALKAYRDSLTITEGLAAADRGNSEWQRDLSISLEKIGDVLLKQGKLDEALKAYRDNLAIHVRLAAADRGNSEWQRDLALSHEKIGDVLVKQGKLDEALSAYRDSFAIFERLAAADRSNTQWQRDLSFSYNGVGDVLFRQGKLDEALTAYRNGLSIAERLAAADRSNTEWQRDLSVSYNNVGDILVAQGRLDEALTAYRHGFAITERLVAANPGNTRWQRDLSVSYNQVGNVMVAQGKLDEALTAYRESLAIRQRLAAANRSNQQWQRDLQYNISRIGGVAYNFILARNFATALEAVDQAVALAPDKTWLYSNRAHALMFLDRVDEARALYLKYRAVQKVVGDKSWETIILCDFAEFRKAGLTHPLMQEIEKTFAGG